MGLSYPPYAAGGRLRPYDPATRPWYLNLFWSYFLGRPFPVSGVYGYTANPTVGISCALASAVAAGDVFLNLQTGQGAYFVPGQTVVVGGNYVWQPFTINAKSGDQLTVFPKSAYAFATGTTVYHTFENDSHPNSVPGWAAWAQAIADARQARGVTGMNLLGFSGTNPVGGMDAFATDANSIANMPVGWVSVNPTQISLVNITVYSVTDFLPAAHTLYGIYLATKGTDTGGTGIQTVSAIPVRAGESYTLSANMMDVGGTPVRLQVIDSDSGAVLAQGVASGDVTQQNYESLGMATYVKFLVPAGTNNIKVQILSLSAGAAVQVDNVRLLKSRQDAIYDRYVIEDPGPQPIVCLGDSWSTVGGGFTYFQAAVRNRIPSATFINAGISGQRLDQQVARMGTDVLPYQPAYCVHLSAWMNDLIQNRTQTQLEGDIDAFINICRANSIVPVIPGVGPTSNASVTGGLQTCHDRNDQMRARCDRINL